MQLIGSGACGVVNAISAKLVPITQPADNAVEVINAICAAVGLPPNFKLVAVTDPSSSAIAEILGTDRYIIYDREYMSSVGRAPYNTWPAFAVIAHEIGHHLCGHTLKTDGSRPPLELEADHFAGFSLARMGAPLPDALQFWSSIIPDVSSATHPPRQERVDAVNSGWVVAMNRKAGEESHTLVSANQNSLGTYDRVTAIFINRHTFWEERQHGKQLALFMEMHRTPEKSIYLYDASRVMSLRLDVSNTGGLASGYWIYGLVTSAEAGWTPLDPKFWPDGMRAADMIKN